MPVRLMNSAMFMWPEVPLPVEEYESLPGWALPIAINSCTEFAASEGGTSRTPSVVPTSMTGAKSRTGL